MQCKYVAVFAAHSLPLPPQADAIQIYQGDPVSAILTKDYPTELLRVADRGAALGAVLLKSVFRSPDPRSFDEKLKQEVADSVAARRRTAGTAPYLVVVVTLDAEVSLQKSPEDLTEFSIYVDAIDKEVVRAKARPFVDDVVATTIVASESDPRFDRLSESTYLITPDDRVLYSLAFSAEGALVSIRAITQDLERKVSKYMLASRAGGGSDLSSVFGLLRAAVDGGAEPLRSFVAAWSALEIFTNKLFKMYERIWFDLLVRDRPSAEIAHLSRIREVMKGKHSLTDKFTVIAFVLDTEGAVTDIPVFNELKNVRDRLLHRGAQETGNLPAPQVVSLIRRYLRLHLERVASAL
jgi:hypothetical protein